MDSIRGIVSRIPKKQIFCEELFQAKAFRDCLVDLRASELSADDFILTPYYVFPEKILELYEYEFRFSKGGFSLEQHLLNLTGQKSLLYIPEDVLRRQKECYVTCDRGRIHVKQLLRYIDFIFSEQSIQEQGMAYAPTFSTENLYFEFY